jgi:hypothetical protein
VRPVVVSEDVTRLSEPIGHEGWVPFTRNRDGLLRFDDGIGGDIHEFSPDEKSRWNREPVMDVMDVMVFYRQPSNPIS